ncbi:hypothetical protein V2W30_18335 [Streptomyces sp. Q6]|uniref:Uncharacterized protein n=1 Tax=Streptomyces citrinus TaxID=3118173 RepID=A0ACD5AD49_9ACTN
MAPDLGATRSVGTLVSTSQYFMDLRTLMALIFASWPAGRTYAATQSLASALDAEAERRHKAYRDLQARLDQSIDRDPAASYYLRAMRRGTSPSLHAALHVDRRAGDLRAHARGDNGTRQGALKNLRDITRLWAAS